MEISAKAVKDLELLIVFAKSSLSEAPSQSGWVPNTNYKIVIRKFPMYIKSKQKKAKKV